MATRPDVVSKDRSPTLPGRTILRAILMAVALFFVWAADSVLFRMNIARARTFITPVGSWLWWICLLAIAGIAFGLAAMLPEHLRYHPVRALVLAMVPLLMLADFTLSLGPSSLVRFGRWGNAEAEVRHTDTTLSFRRSGDPVFVAIHDRFATRGCGTR